MCINLIFPLPGLIVRFVFASLTVKFTIAREYFCGDKQHGRKHCIARKLTYEGFPGIVRYVAIGARLQQVMPPGTTRIYIESPCTSRDSLEGSVDIFVIVAWCITHLLSLEHSIGLILTTRPLWHVRYLFFHMQPPSSCVANIERPCHGWAIFMSKCRCRRRCGSNHHKNKFLTSGPA
uniref:Putative secreted protein n=1 Tax=Anopheles darlingi TaxID=43151 RepID=A0A2M4DPE9_ANODA